MPTRSLSPLESKLILHLEWEKQPTITIHDVQEILDVSYDHARQLLHRLARDRWLAPIRSGLYELIPAERGEHAFVDTNPFFVGSTLVEPYYFSFATAAFFYGLSSQASFVVYIATTQNMTRQLLVRGKEYHLVLQPAHKFFGWSEVDAYGSLVNMAEPEKTILDSLDRPAYAGDIPEIAAMLWRGKSHLVWHQIVEYAVRFKSQTLLQRLGYLVDLLQVPISEESRNILLEKSAGKNKCYLGQLRRWKTGGEYDSTWRIVDNIPRKELLVEIEVAG
jgi:predicted transcriptional regulator of viral defense system